MLKDYPYFDAAIQEIAKDKPERYKRLYQPILYKLDEYDERKTKPATGRLTRDIDRLWADLNKWCLDELLHFSDLEMLLNAIEKLENQPLQKSTTERLAPGKSHKSKHALKLWSLEVTDLSERLSAILKGSRLDRSLLPNDERISDFLLSVADLSEIEAQLVPPGYSHPMRIHRVEKRWVLGVGDWFLSQTGKLHQTRVSTIVGAMTGLEVKPDDDVYRWFWEEREREKK